MAHLTWVFATIPPTVAVVASLFSQKIISPGSGWTVVIATISLYATAFGAIQSHVGQKIIQKMQDIDVARGKRRKHALAQHEIPHILHLLNMLVHGMDRTTLTLNKYSKDGKIHTSEAAEYMRKRATMHIESIRAIEAFFPAADLSEYFEFLDGALVNLDEIALVPQPRLADVSMLEESADMAFNAMNSISDRYGVKY